LSGFVPKGDRIAILAPEAIFMTAVNAGSADSDALAYSVNDTARQTGLSRSTIYELFEAGKLAYLKIGKRRLVERDEIKRFLAAHRVGG
jgi:excisionase family DNA binding protein